MKILISIMLVLAGQQALAVDEWQNEVFSGVFKVESCSPSCDQIVSGKGIFYNYFKFEKIEGISISVVDNMPTVTASSIFKTCDGSTKPFEFNLWTFGKNNTGSGYQTGHFMNNNLNDDSANPWRNVCNGKFSSSASMVSLVSPDISIKLKKITDEDFELSWTDARWGISGSFKLKKDWYY